MVSLVGSTWSSKDPHEHFVLRVEREAVVEGMWRCLVLVDSLKIEEEGSFVNYSARVLEKDFEMIVREDHVIDRTGQTWEDRQGEIHLIVRHGRTAKWEGKAVIHDTLCLLTGERRALVDMPDRKLENREGWRRLA